MIIFSFMDCDVDRARGLEAECPNDDSQVPQRRYLGWVGSLETNFQ